MFTDFMRSIQSDTNELPFLFAKGYEYLEACFVHKFQMPWGLPRGLLLPAAFIKQFTVTYRIPCKESTGESAQGKH